MCVAWELSGIPDAVNGIQILECKGKVDLEL